MIEENEEISFLERPAFQQIESLTKEDIEIIFEALKKFYTPEDSRDIILLLQKFESLKMYDISKFLIVPYEECV